MLKPEDRERIIGRLNSVHQWPSVYMFKMILEPSEERIEQVLALFPPEAEITRKFSSAGKYMSITAREVMTSADAVLERYEQVAAVPGLITL